MYIYVYIYIYIKAASEWRWSPATPEGPFRPLGDIEVISGFGPPFLDAPLGGTVWNL